MKKYIAEITIGILCFVLTTAILIQIRTIESATTEVGSTLSDNSGLIDEVLMLQSEYEEVHKELEKAEKKLEEKRTEATLGNEEDTQSENKIKAINKLLGLTEVVGDGIVITLDENREIEATELIDASQLLVHEEDLLQIVNELFNAGADAISINDQRIVSSTAILCDGNIIRINGEIVGAPFTIKAIGHQAALWNLLRPQGYLQWMANDGIIVKTEKVQNITISKYEGIYSYSYLNRGDSK